jgi:hypothetical protein
MQSLTRSALALAVVASGIAGCDQPPSTVRPTPLPGASPVLSMLGPADLFSGGSAQFQMVAVVGSTHVDITPQTAWSTSESAVLTVSPSGVAAAYAPGPVTVYATYQNRTVIAGIGTGLKVVAVEDPEFPPMYVLRGVAGPVTIAASAAGYMTQTIEIDVQRHTRRDIVMVPAPRP